MTSRFCNTLAALALALLVCAAAPAAHAQGVAAGRPGAAAEPVVYTGPMHPEVKS